MRKFFVPATAVCFIIILTALIAEGFARIAGGPPAAFFYSGSFVDRQTDWLVTYRVGMGNRRLTCFNDDNAKQKIAVIGDSFVFGQGVSECETFVSRLASLLPSAQFVNFGIIGVGVDEYKMVARDFIDSSFSDVIVLFYGNDIGINNKGLFGALADSLSSLSVIRRAKRAVVAESLLLSHAYNSGPGTRAIKTDDVTFNNIASILQDDREYFYKVAAPDAVSIQHFSTQFRELVNVLDNSVPRNRLWVAVVPEGTTVSPGLREFVEKQGGQVAAFGAPGSGYEAVKTLAESEGVNFIDLFPAFLSSSEDNYFPHDLHWSPAGHRLAANAFDSVMKQAFIKRTGHY